MIASDWRSVVKGTQRGLCTIKTASGLRIHEVRLHERDGERWVALPGKYWKKENGTSVWISTFNFPDAETKKLFKAQALAAINVMLAELTGERHEANR